MGNWREVLIEVPFPPEGHLVEDFLQKAIEDEESVLHSGSAYFDYDPWFEIADVKKDGGKTFRARFNVRSHNDSDAFRFVSDLAMKIENTYRTQGVRRHPYVSQYQLVGWTRMDQTEIPTLLYFFQGRVVPVGMASTLLHKAPKELW